MTEKTFQDLLTRPEGETLDFKATGYDLQNIEKRVDLIKDVLAMANTPREDLESYIVLGVRRNRDGSTQLLGLRQLEDDADLQSQFSERLSPVPKFRYITFELSGKTFGAIVVTRDLSGPFTLSKGFHSIGKGQIYFRRGSKNEIATGDEIRRIFEWFKSQGRALSRTTRRTGAWQQLIDAVYHFDPHRRYILVVSPIREDLSDRTESLAEVPWSSVFDFDPDSEQNGLLAHTEVAVSSKRSLHLAVRGELVASSLRSTIWFFSRGLRGRQDTIQEGAYKEWLRDYSRELERQFERLAASISPIPATIIVLWYHRDLDQHLRRTLEIAVTQFRDAANVVVATCFADQLHSVLEPLGVPIIDLPLHDMCSGIAAHFAKESAQSVSFQFPGADGAPILVDLDKARWLQEDLELADLGTGLAVSTDVDPRREFLRGGEIGWDALGLHSDVDRDLTKKLKGEVEEKLEERRAVRLNLYHAPGAGGTTVGKRIIWDLHEKYPSVVLARCIPNETARRFYFLTSQTRLPLLVMVDGARVAERQIDDLYTELKAQHVPVVLLQVLRRVTVQLGLSGQ